MLGMAKIFSIPPLRSYAQIIAIFFFKTWGNGLSHLLLYRKNIILYKI